MNTNRLITITYFISIFLVATSIVWSQQNFWTLTNGPYGGNPAAICASIDGDLYVCIGKNLYRSTNNGDSWVLIHSEPRGLLRSVSAYKNGIVYLGVESSSGQSTLMRSTDFGASWVDLDLGFENPIIRFLEIDSLGNVYATSDIRPVGVIFRSTDIGETWHPYSGSLPYITKLLVTPSGDIYAATQIGVYRIQKGDTNWVSIGPNNERVGGIAINNNNDIFISTWHGLLKSTNGGGSWISINQGLFDSVVTSLTFTPNGYVYAATFSGILRSTNEGANWEHVSSGLRNYQTRILIANKMGHLFTGVYYGGIYRSTNYGAEWTSVSTGIAEGIITSIAVHPEGDVFATAWGDGVYRTSDRGNTWVNVVDGLKHKTSRSIVITSEGNLFVGNVSAGGIYRSTNKGGNWTHTVNGLSFHSILSLATFPGLLLVGTDGGGIFRSTDNGENWFAINSNTQPRYPRSIIIESSTTFYVAEDNFWSGGGIYRTTNGGISWNRSFSGSAYSLIRTKDGTLFAGIDTSIYRSTNSGDDWIRMNAALGKASVVSFSVNSLGHLFAGTNKNGIYFSTDNGANWAVLNSGLTNLSIRFLAIDNDDFLYAGPQNGVVHRSAGSTTVVPNTDALLPARSSLHQNYPNPFNPSTQINYSISMTSFITLKIYDLLGREITTLLNERKQPGYYSISWNAQGYPSGIYLYRLQTEKYSETKKLILIR